MPANLHQVQFQDRSMIMNVKRMMIGDLAAAGRTQVTTVRFYERAGLMPLPERTAGGHRNYTSDHVRRLVFIRRAREMEFSIEEIKLLVTFAEPTPTSCREVQNLVSAHLKGLRHKITCLVQVETLLAGAIAQCSGKSTAPCPVLELLKVPD